jgi:uncharacterized membrane protein
MPYAFPIVVLATAGLGVSVYIWYKQVTTGPVLCVGRGCAAVIRSRYGRMLAIPNGAWGTVYFGAVGIAAIVGLVAPPAAPTLGLLSLAASTITVGLHVYLTYLQFFVLRALCSWCLTSAGLSASITLLLALGAA